MSGAHDGDAVRLPIAVAIDAHYDGLREDRLLITRCSACGRHQFPPRAVCYGCHRAGTLRWVEASGHGEVWSFVVFHKAYFPSEVRQVPYTVAVVQLSEGPRLISNLLGVGDADVAVGQRVRATFTHDAGQHLVVFTPDVTHPAPTPASPDAVARP